MLLAFNTYFSIDEWNRDPQQSGGDRGETGGGATKRKTEDTQIENTTKHPNVPAYDTVHGRLNTSSELPELQNELDNLQQSFPEERQNELHKRQYEL